MNGAELITEVRIQTQDTVAPFLWGDPLILRYLREAELILCKRTHVLVAPSIILNAVAGEATCQLDARILRVYAARVASSNRPLSRMRGHIYPAHISSTLAEPRYYGTDIGSKFLTLHPVPEVDVDIELLCAVSPGTPVDYDRDSEIPEEDQTALIDYASYRSLIIPDEDGESLPAAEIFQERWLKYLRDLKREIYRYRTGDKLEIANWTGKRNGHPN